MALGTRPLGPHQLDELQGPCCLVAVCAGADQGAVGDDVGHQAFGTLATWPRLNAKGPGPGLPPQKNVPLGGAREDEPPGPMARRDGRGLGGTRASPATAPPPTR